MKNIERENENSIDTAFAVIICSERVVLAWKRICLITEN